MRERGLAFASLDLSPGRWRKGAAYHLTRMGRTVGAGFAMLAASVAARRPRYIMSLDGGAGLAYNIALALAARITRRPMMFYHHSSSYVLADSALIRLLLRLCANAPHIFCSRRMAELFWRRYGDRGTTVIISNAAWIAPLPVVTAVGRPKIRLGFLGTLTLDKGLGRAIDALRALLERGIAAELVLAGLPVTADDRALLDRSQTEFGSNLVHRGVLSGPAKTEFLLELDYLLFPSLYAHETQSLVVPEALAASVPVIAIDHRFVGEILGDGGLLISVPQHFAQEAADWIAAGQAVHQERRMQARRQFEAQHLEASGQLDRLVDWSLGKA